MNDRMKHTGSGGAGSGYLRLVLKIGLPLAVLVLLPGGVNGWVLASGVVVSALFVGLAGWR